MAFAFELGSGRLFCKLVPLSSSTDNHHGDWLALTADAASIYEKELSSYENPAFLQGYSKKDFDYLFDLDNKIIGRYVQVGWYLNTPITVQLLLLISHSPNQPIILPLDANLFPFVASNWSLNRFPADAVLNNLLSNWSSLELLSCDDSVLKTTRGPSSALSSSVQL